MKKIISCAFVLLFLFFISINCFAQSSNNNEQRLVGTWISLHNSEYTFTFNSNGTISGEYFSQSNWAAAGDILLLFGRGGNLSENISQRRFQISNDGRTLIINDRAFRRG